jgi:branched-subunit amino acid transport protein
MAGVTYCTRVLPIVLLEHFKLPKFIEEWLQFVPSAVMAALLFPSIFLVNQHVDLSFHNLFLWASIPTLIIALWSRHFLGTVLSGSCIVALIRYFIASP